MSEGCSNFSSGNRYYVVLQVGDLVVGLRLVCSVRIPNASSIAEAGLPFSSEEFHLHFLLGGTDCILSTNTVFILDLYTWCLIYKIYLYLLSQEILFVCAHKDS